MIKCPVHGSVLYMDCMECDDKICKRPYHDLVIGIDQSYTDTGISVITDAHIRDIRHIPLTHYKTKTEKRRVLAGRLNGLLSVSVKKARNVICIIERCRLKGCSAVKTGEFVDLSTIMSMGSLNATIVDTCSPYGVPVYSVDTRAWKSASVGTSRPRDNNYGVEPQKWPTIEWLIKLGYEDKILMDVTDTKKEVGTFLRNGRKYMYNDNAADSCGIAMFWYKGDKKKLKLEK